MSTDLFVGTRKSKWAMWTLLLHP